MEIDSFFGSKPSQANCVMHFRLGQDEDESQSGSGRASGASSSLLVDGTSLLSTLSNANVKKANMETIQETFVNDMQRHLYKIDLADLLGHGTYGSVYKVTKENRVMAVKIMSTMMGGKHFNSKLAQLFENEQTALEAIGTHPNIVSLVESFSEFTEVADILKKGESGQLKPISVFNFYSILEYTDRGTLGELVCKQPSGFLTEVEGKSFALDLFRAVSHIHKLGVYHLDIKPENLLLFPGSQGPLNLTIKLTDFGLAKNEPTMEYGVGSYTTMAPELLRNLWLVRNGYSAYQLANECAQADAWSVGATVFYTLHGRYPLNDKGKLDDLGKVFRRADGRLETRDKRYHARLRGLVANPNQRLSPQCIRMLKRLLEVNPRRRSLVTKNMNINHWIHNESIFSPLFYFAWWSR